MAFDTNEVLLILQYSNNLRGGTGGTTVPVQGKLCTTLAGNSLLN